MQTLQENEKPSNLRLTNLTIFEISIICSFLNASQKISQIAHLSKQWRRFVFSGYAWRDFVNLPDNTWNRGILFSESSSLLKKFNHFRGMCSIPIDLHSFGPQINTIDLSEAESILFHILPAYDSDQALSKLFESNPILIKKISKLILEPKLDLEEQQIANAEFMKIIPHLSKFNSVTELKVKIPSLQIGFEFFKSQVLLEQLVQLNLSLSSQFTPDQLYLTPLTKLKKLAVFFQDSVTSEEHFVYYLPFKNLPTNVKELELSNFILKLNDLTYFTQLERLSLMEISPYEDKDLSLLLPYLQEIRVEIRSHFNFRIKLQLPKVTKCAFAFYQKHETPLQFEIESHGPLNSQKLIIAQMQEMQQLIVDNFATLASTMKSFHSHRFFIGDSKALHRDYSLIETHTLQNLSSLKLESYMPQNLSHLSTLLPNLKELELEQQSHSSSTLVAFSHPRLESFILKAILPKIEFNIVFTENCSALDKVVLVEVKSFSIFGINKNLKELHLNSELNILNQKKEKLQIGLLSLEDSAWKSENITHLARQAQRIELNQEAVQVFQDQKAIELVRHLTLYSSIKRQGEVKSKFFRQPSKSSNLLYHLELIQAQFSHLLYLKVQIDLMANFFEEIPLVHRQLQKIQFYARRRASGNKIHKVVIYEDCTSLEIFELKRVELEFLTNLAKQMIAFRGMKSVAHYSAKKLE